MQLPRFSNHIFFCAVLACAGVITADHALAQDTGSAVMATGPYTEPDASAVTPAETRVLQSGTPNQPDLGATMTAKPVPDTPRRLQYTLTGTVRGVYDDNINNSSFRHVSDFYFTVEPSLYVGLGGGESDAANSVTLTYQPSLFLFVDNSQNDGFQQLIRLQAGHRFGHLGLALSQDVQLLDGTDLNSLSDPTGHQANTDVSGRNRHQVYTTDLSGTYDLTGKLFLSGGGNFFADQYSSSLSSSQYFSGNLYINYNYSEKLVMGFGGTGGYNTVGGATSNDQTFEQANIRLGYAATSKISVSGTAGAEFRQFEKISGTDVNPVFTLSASYAPFDGTAISLTGSRQTRNSASLAGQDYAETTVNFSVTQRFLQRFFFGFAVGYSNSDYFSAASGVNASRNDDFFYITPSVDFNVTRFWTFGAYYVHREDNSSFAIFSFNDNQFGVRTKLTF